MTEDLIAKKISCSHSGCSRVLRVLKEKMCPINGYVRSQGWFARGSLDGMIYFCDEHPPGYGGARKKRAT